MNINAYAKAFAKIIGAARYFIGIPCQHGHISERFTSNGRCVQCAYEFRAPESNESKARRAAKARSKTRKSPRRIARENGDLRYTSMRPCKGGHIAERFTSNGMCTRCVADKFSTPEGKAIRSEYSKRYHETPKGKAKIKVAKHARRAAAQNAEGSHTRSDILNLFDLQRGRCASCASCLKVRGALKYHVDHVIPLSRGGSNDKSNLQLLCPTCNLKKGSKDPSDWAVLCGRLL